MGKASVANLMLLGDIYLADNAPDVALPLYLEGIEKDGGHHVTRSLRAADILTSRGAWDEADTLFKKIRAISGADLASEDEMKLLKLESKRAMATGAGEQAIQTLEKIIEKNPLDGEALLMAGDYYAQNGQREKAEFRYETAEKISGFEADAWVKHAQLLVQSQHYTQAVELLRKAQQLKPRAYVQTYLEKVELVARGGRS